MLHFYKTPSIVKKIYGDLVWNVPSSNKEIYLTFDDGPIPGLTEHILDLLDEYDAKAVFFCVGDNLRKHTQIAEQILNKGHVIGNHTYNHLKGWKVSNRSYLENIAKCQQYINALKQSESIACFRPPHGQISRSQIKAVRKNYQIIMWDILAYDFETSHSPSQSLERIITLTKPGSILVFHDNYKAEKKLRYMLPRFLRHFTEKGFSFKVLNME